MEVSQHFTEGGFDCVTKAIVELYRTDDPLANKFADDLLKLRERYKNQFELRDYTRAGEYYD